MTDEGGGGGFDDMMKGIRSGDWGSSPSSGSGEQPISGSSQEAHSGSNAGAQSSSVQGWEGLSNLEEAPRDYRPKSITQALRQADRNAGVKVGDVTGHVGRDPISGARIVQDTRTPMQDRRAEVTEVRQQGLLGSLFSFLKGK